MILWKLRRILDFQKFFRATAYSCTLGCLHVGHERNWQRLFLTALASSYRAISHKMSSIFSESLFYQTRNILDGNQEGYIKARSHRYSDKANGNFVGDFVWYIDVFFACFCDICFAWYFYLRLAYRFFRYYMWYTNLVRKEWPHEDDNLFGLCVIITARDLSMLLTHSFER